MAYGALRTLERKATGLLRFLEDISQSVLETKLWEEKKCVKNNVYFVFSLHGCSFTETLRV